VVIEADSSPEHAKLRKLEKERGKGVEAKKVWNLTL
jgi:hypothetical protein